MGSSLGLLKHEVNTRDFIFHGIRRWVAINLVTLIHGYLHLISLVIVVGYWELRSFQETQVIKKPRFSRNPGYGNPGFQETQVMETHVSIAELLKLNLMSQVVKLLRSRTMLKMLYFSGDHQFCQKSPGIKFLYDRSRKLSHLLVGEVFPVKLSTGEATGASVTETLGQGVYTGAKAKMFFSDGTIIAGDTIM